MWHRIKDLWAHNRTALVAFVAVLALTGFFGLRTVSNYIYWADPAHQNQTLAGWMTPRYVARSYAIPPEVVKAAWGLDPDSPLKRASLDTIAVERGMTLDQMQAQIIRAAVTWHQSRAHD